MKITLIGYGTMGKEVEAAALSRGHEIILIIDKDNADDLDKEIFKQSDVAIEFTTPETAFENIEKCINRGVPVVSGTTGWTDRLEEAQKLAVSEGGCLLYASNFSLGVNILFNLNRKLAEIMNEQEAYSVKLEEIHHARKKDAPSGTAKSLAEDIISKCKKYGAWSAAESASGGEIGIKSVREGDVPGTHRVEWKSDIDDIIIEHRAHNRRGFALGAVFAAEFIQNRQGVFTMKDLLGF
ncbi:MAG: 4-hydroxy-tetrahydrodipicolinate reductase [Bacteroidales bacterium]|nr:4-hydroxy-tetrahydrodipicolinate reductase [Bacteroidales bacterium]